MAKESLRYVPGSLLLSMARLLKSASVLSLLSDAFCLAGPPDSTLLRKRPMLRDEQHSLCAAFSLDPPIPGSLGDPNFDLCAKPYLATVFCSAS